MHKFIFALLYGNHSDLHKRLLDSFDKHIPEIPDIEVHLWCNTVGETSRKRINASRYSVTFSEVNLPKYKAMEILFKKPKQMGEDHDWVVWFDDDSYITDPAWLAAALALAFKPEVRYMGQPWYVHHLPGQWEFIKESEWFKSRPPEMLPTRDPRKKKAGVSFAQGAYWWLRVDALRALDWPDPRLKHNGGDTLLGEAVRQQGWQLNKCQFGVSINEAGRRGMNERPAGSLVDARR